MDDSCSVQCGIGGFLPLCNCQMDGWEEGHWLTCAKPQKKKKKNERRKRLQDFQTVGALMELSQAQHAGFSLYLCVQHAPVKDASLPHHVLVHYALVHLVKDAPTCPGAPVHASCLQSRGHLSATIYPHLHCSPSICSCETLFPYSRRCEIGEGGTMHSLPNGKGQDLTFHSAHIIMFV